MADSRDSIRKVKILVLGDPGENSLPRGYFNGHSLGVGKSAFVNLFCLDEVLSNSSSTVGCNIEVKVGRDGDEDGACLWPQ